MRLAQLWLEVALVKTVEHGVGHEHDQPENKDGVGMMMEAVTGMPAGDQFVEAFVFDFPTIVSEVEDGSAIGQGAGHGRGPPPVAVDRSFDPFSGDALAASAGFVGMDHAQLGVDGFGAEALGLLQDDVSRGFAGRGRGVKLLLRVRRLLLLLLERQEGARLGQELGLVGFEHGDEVLAVFFEEFDH